MKYRVKLHPNGMYFVQVKGWIFWWKLGIVIGIDPGTFITTFHSTADEAEDAARQHCYDKVSAKRYAKSRPFWSTVVRTGEV